MESMDSRTVADNMGAMLIGHYFEVSGVKIEKNLIVDSIKPFKADVMKQVDALLMAAEA